MSLLHQQALQRLTYLRLANIASWLVLLLYLGYQHYTIHRAAFFCLGGYLLLLAWSHLWVKIKPSKPRTVLLHLCMECGLLAVLLYFSGGAANPLISYFLVLILLAAYILPRRETGLVALLSILLYSLLMHWHQPLLAHTPNQQSLFDLHLLGMWLNFGVSALIFALLIPNMQQNRERQRQEIQALREQQLKNEQLIGIATLAAGTAHEMGTPLMTMQMLINEQNSQVPISADDLHILSRQVERCRQSLKRLSNAGRDIQNISPQAAVKWLEVLLERWRLSHPKAQWQDLGLCNNACIITSPLLDQALLNLLDNAAEAGNAPIKLSCCIDQGYWQLSITQPDERAADNLQKRHNFSSSKEHGLGLGLYLSNASVEQFGGYIHLQAQSDGSSLCVLALPLHNQAEANQEIISE